MIIINGNNIIGSWKKLVVCGPIAKLTVPVEPVAFATTFAIPSYTKHIPKEITIGGSLVVINTNEWIKPNIIPNKILNNKNWKICSIVSTPGTISEANKHAKIPVAPKEKSILPETSVGVQNRYEDICQNFDERFLNQFNKMKAKKSKKNKGNKWID